MLNTSLKVEESVLYLLFKILVQLRFIPKVQVNDPTTCSPEQDTPLPIASPTLTYSGFLLAPANTTLPSLLWLLAMTFIRYKKLIKQELGEKLSTIATFKRKKK